MNSLFNAYSEFAVQNPEPVLGRVPLATESIEPSGALTCQQAGMSFTYGITD